MKDEHRTKEQLVNELVELRQRVAELEATDTEREREEEALRESEERYRLLFDSSPDSVTVVNTEGVIAECSQTGVLLYGYPREEMVGKHITEFMHPSSVAVFREKFPQLRRLEPVQEEIQIARSDGSIVEVWRKGVPLTDEDGNFAGVLVHDRAITERKRAEEALRALSSRHEAILAAVPDIIMEVDGSKVYTWVNQAGFEFFGEDVLGKEAAFYFEGEQETYDTVQPLFNGDENVIYVESWQRRQDGEKRLLAWWCRVLKDPNGNVTGALSTARDITERKWAEKALRGSEKRHRLLLSSITDGCWVLDAEWRYTLVNEAGGRLVGMLPDQLLGRKLTVLFPGIEKSEFFAAYERSMRERIVESVAAPFTFPDGREGVYEVQVYPVPDGILCMGRNITERKQAEEALQRSLEETARGHRMLLALSQAAQAVQRARTAQEVYRTVGDEVVKLGYHAVVFTLTNDRQHLTIPHLTIKPSLLRAAEKLTGLSLQTFRIPLVQAPVFQRILTEGEVSFDEPAADFMAGGLPERLRSLAGRIAAMLGLEQCITAPLTVSGETVGLLQVTGAGLTEADVPAVTTFANQAAIAIENTSLYEASQRELAERKRAEEELRRTLEKLREALGGIIQTVVLTVETRDPYTAGHQRRVSNLARAIADEMGLPQEQIDGIRMAGLIHDLGKISLPAEILSKPVALNDFEYGLIRAHSQTAYDILKTVGFPWPVATIVFQHHERLDGSGYPQGLSGEEIILEARILAVADVVEAMASFRPYRPARGLDRGLEEITQNRGILYDAEVVDVCLKLFTEEGFEFERDEGSNST